MSENYLDIPSWNRKEHYDFFRAMELPFFGLVAEVECSYGYKLCRQKGYSFFLYYLHKCLVAVNSIENLKYRIEEDKVRIYDTIHVSPTIGRADHTFGFSFLPYEPDFIQFSTTAQVEIDNIRAQTGLCLSPAANRADVVHFSALPWVAFTHLSHAGMIQNPGSVPKISVGKLVDKQNRYFMPVSIHLHHALADGYHAGQFFEKLEKLLNS